MSARSKPYELTWEQNPKDLAEVNRQLALQLSNANKMIDILFTAVKDLTARVEALE
jgi:hypothetical protein